jgi:HK97 family phage major capsid protein
MPNPELVRKRNLLSDKHDFVNQIMAEGKGPSGKLKDFDIARVTSITGSVAQKQATLRTLNDEVEELTSEVKALVDAENEQREANGFADPTSMIFPPDPNGPKTGANSWKARVGSGPKQVNLKSVLAGGTTLPPLLAGQPVDDPRRARYFYELLPTDTIAGTDRFAYFEQTTRTDNAAPVAKGGTKPTSVYTLTKREKALVVIAHLSEAVDKYDLMDTRGLSDFLDREMRGGLQVALDTEALQGDGTGAHMTGILATSGIQTQALGADPLTDALLKAITKIAVGNEGAKANLIAMHPNNWQTLLLLRSADGEYIAGMPGSPIDPNGMRLWGLPVFVTVSMPTNKALVLDTSTVRLVEGREGIELDADTSAGFDVNTIKLRAEMRAQIAVEVPNLVCVVTGL